MQEDNDLTIKNLIIEKLYDLFKPMTFDNQQLPITNIYVTGDLVFLFILLGKEEYSCPK